MLPSELKATLEKGIGDVKLNNPEEAAKPYLKYLNQGKLRGMDSLLLIFEFMPETRTTICNGIAALIPHGGLFAERHVRGGHQFDWHLRKERALEALR